MMSLTLSRGAKASKLKLDVQVWLPLTIVRVKSRLVPLGTLSATVMPNTLVRSAVWLGVKAGIVAVLWLMVTNRGVRVLRVAVACVEAKSPTFLMTMSNEACSPYSSWALLPSLTVTSLRVSSGSLMTVMLPT